MRRALAFGAALALATAADAAPQRVRLPLACSRGSGEAWFDAVVTMPSSAAPGATCEVRIDSVPSGRVQHAGLRHIHDMRTDYALPAGVTVLPGSVRVVPDTGTPDVRVGARAWSDAAGVHLLLPASVQNGSAYTPPSVAFAVRVDAPEGAVLPVSFAHYEVTANVFLLGDLHTACEPTTRPAVLGTLRVERPG
jgi:hypothetical protein